MYGSRDANDNNNNGSCIYVNLQDDMEKKYWSTYYARNSPKILFVLYVLHKLLNDTYIPLPSSRDGLLTGKILKFFSAIFDGGIVWLWRGEDSRGLPTSEIVLGEG